MFLKETLWLIKKTVQCNMMPPQRTVHLLELGGIGLFSNSVYFRKDLNLLVSNSRSDSVVKLTESLFNDENPWLLEKQLKQVEWLSVDCIPPLKLSSEFHTLVDISPLNTFIYMFLYVTPVLDPHHNRMGSSLTHTTSFCHFSWLYVQ